MVAVALAVGVGTRGALDGGSRSPASRGAGDDMSVIAQGPVKGRSSGSVRRASPVPEERPEDHGRHAPHLVHRHGPCSIDGNQLFN